MSKKVEEQKIELLNWQMLRDSADDLFEELDAKIASVKKEVNYSYIELQSFLIQRVLLTIR